MHKFIFQVPHGRAIYEDMAAGIDFSYGVTCKYSSVHFNVILIVFEFTHRLFDDDIYYRGPSNCAEIMRVQGHTNPKEHSVYKTCKGTFLCRTAIYEACFLAVRPMVHTVV
jgi:hypothetical protein